MERFFSRPYFKEKSKLFILSLSFLLLSCSSKDKNATTTTDGVIDVHAHINLESSSVDLSQIESAMDDQLIKWTIIMPTPFGVPSTSETNGDDLQKYVSDNGYSQFAFMYGGQELNPLVHAVGRGEVFTEELLYPNGTGGMDISDSVSQMNAIAGDPETYYTQFKTLATTAAESGLYVGFGELGPRHFSKRSGHPDVLFPANHEWMLWLSDLAAENNMVLDVHMEVENDTLSEFEELLSHNESTKIIWEHAGWSNTGLIVASQLASLLENHSNLYLAIKLRNPNSDEMTTSHPLDESGVIVDDWKELLETYSTRIMIGADLKYWNNETNISEMLSDSMGYYVALLDQIDESARLNIRGQTAKAVFGLEF